MPKNYGMRDFHKKGVGTRDRDHPFQTLLTVLKNLTWNQIWPVTHIQRPSGSQNIVFTIDFYSY